MRNVKERMKKWIVWGLSLATSPAIADDLYVAPDGSDANPGTKEAPLATLSRARDTLRSLKPTKPVTVFLRGGTYELTSPVVFTPLDSGTKQAPITYCSYPNEEVVISGGQKMNLKWQPWRDGIMQAKTPPDTSIDQLFVNGKRQLISPAEVALWKRGASNAGYHYLGCAKTFALMGKAFAEANLKMLETRRP